MRNKIILILIIILIISGCNVGPKRNDKDRHPISEADIKVGTEGLKMEFLETMPPEKIFEKAPFPVSVQLKNKGASDIKDGVLALGIEEDYMRLAENQVKVPFNIEGKSIVNLEGGEKIINWGMESRNIESQSESHISTILATACYTYKTNISTSICIDPDVYSLKRDIKSCTVKDVTFSKGQGAPIAVTKVETQMLPDFDGQPDFDDKIVKPQIIIYIENKGNGEVINLENYKKVCSKEALEYRDYNTIFIEAFLSGKEMDCTPKEDFLNEVEKRGYIRLKSKKDIIRCVLEEGLSQNKPSYTTPLKIVLSYGYTFTISKDVTIEKILTY
jgi:hypothetical protein